MTWKCGVCGTMDGQKNNPVDSVCHHCGKPLCARHQVVIVDRRFGFDRENSRPRAVHCRECKLKHHRFALSRRPMKRVPP